MPFIRQVISAGGAGSGRVCPAGFFCTTLSSRAISLPSDSRQIVLRSAGHVPSDWPLQRPVFHRLHRAQHSAPLTQHSDQSSQSDSARDEQRQLRFTPWPIDTCPSPPALPTICCRQVFPKASCSTTRGACSFVVAIAPTVTIHCRLYGLYELCVPLRDLLWRPYDIAQHLVSRDAICFR